MRTICSANLIIIDLVPEKYLVSCTFYVASDLEVMFSVKYSNYFLCLTPKYLLQRHSESWFLSHGLLMIKENAEFFHLEPQRRMLHVWTMVA